MAIQMMTEHFNAPNGRFAAEPTPRQTAALWGRGRTVTTDWGQGLPVLAGKGVQLRELRTSDAASLFALLTTEEVARFISPPPTSVEGFVRFIEWTHRRRAEGRHVCFAVVPDGHDAAVGLIQFHTLGQEFDIAEWGFAIGSAYWGRGLFEGAARLVLEFAFEQVGVRRMEARAVTENGRGNGALRKLGAVCEARLRQTFAKGRVRYDQFLWAILDSDWRRARLIRREDPLRVH
jgi:RimJ/RimL family protein N-acetyltransferase